MENWYKSWFESEEYLDVYSHREESDAEKLLALIRKHLSLKINSKILDAACGSGRFSNYLSKEGFDVTSFDLSSQLLRTAKENSTKFSNPIKLVRADMRNLPFNGTFDLVLNMFTSFGYFMNDEENYSFIKEVSNLLSNNGYFIFDFLNKEFVERNIIPKSVRVIDDKIITEQREIINNRVEKRITISVEKNEKIFHESVYLYTKNEIIDSFKQFELKVVEIFGDYSGNPFDNSISERLMIIFNK